MASTVVRLWEELRAWYGEILPEAAQTLNPGADEGDLEAALRQTTGQGLPQPLREVYRQNDGQNLRAASGLFFGLTFLSVADAFEQWRTWRRIAEDDPDLAAEAEFASSYPPGAIRPEYIDLGRVPFAYDWGRSSTSAGTRRTSTSSPPR